MWAYESVFYQIYPLGFSGAPFENDGVLNHRILKVNDWIPHIKRLGADAIYFSPVFESDTHGYNTRDYTKIDTRLGTNKDFANVCYNLHNEGIKVVLDGVFNHVGRGFWAFQDVLKNRESSPYINWFARIDFNGNSNYNDGLWYEGWEGCYDLVKLNLYNEDVIQHIFNAIKGWVTEFDIDGLRLHSVTNYECYKGLYSSFNSMNMFEINHSLLRQFGPENWTLYKGKHLLSFVDNHDVTRVASILNNIRHLPLIYALAFGMPGIPCVYYGSEWGATGRKEDGDPALRACFDTPVFNELSDWIAKLANAKKISPALQYGNFSSIILTNEQCVFLREWRGERVLVAINAADYNYSASFNMGCDKAYDLITDREIQLNNGLELPGYSAFFLKL